MCVDFATYGFVRSCTKKVEKTSSDIAVLKKVDNPSVKYVQFSVNAEPGEICPMNFCAQAPGIVRVAALPCRRPRIAADFDR